MKILLVEDEHTIARQIVSGLKSEGFVIDHIDNGLDGSDRACNYEYDLIILDYKLPHKTGVEICEDIRRVNKKTPILILSVLNIPEIKAMCLNKGADDYLCKPFSFEELIARAHALLRRVDHINTETLSLGDLTLDVEHYCVMRDDKEILLTNKEFMLLEYFLRNQRKVLSRSVLIENVWGMNTSPLSNTVESHMRSLRKKIEVGSGKKMIHTISGRGYKMSTD